MRFWRGLILTMALMLVLGDAAWAEVPPHPARTLPELNALFPSTAQLPPGMVLQKSGERSEAEIAASFVDPADAAAILHTTDWVFNAYQVYVAGVSAMPEAPARLEISLHQFSTNSGAAFALPYFVHGRAVVLGHPEAAPWALRSPCIGGMNEENGITRYQRIGDLLVRVTLISQATVSTEAAYYEILRMSDAIIAIMVANAGSSQQILSQTCL